MHGSSQKVIRTVSHTFAKLLTTWVLEKLSKEMYEVLVMTTEGEAKKMIRIVPDKDGILAWHRLSRHCNRKTLARVLRIPTARRCIPNLRLTLKT